MQRGSQTPAKAPAAGSSLSLYLPRLHVAFPQPSSTAVVFDMGIQVLWLLFEQPHLGRTAQRCTSPAHTVPAKPGGKELTASRHRRRQHRCSHKAGEDVICEVLSSSAWLPLCLRHTVPPITLLHPLCCTSLPLARMFSQNPLFYGCWVKVTEHHVADPWAQLVPHTHCSVLFGGQTSTHPAALLRGSLLKPQDPRRATQKEGILKYQVVNYLHELLLHYRVSECKFWQKIGSEGERRT